MPNQRRKDKRNITVTMEDELRIAVEKYAKLNGIDRTAAIKEMCREILGLPQEQPGEAPAKPAGRGKKGKPAKSGKKKAGK